MRAFCGFLRFFGILLGALLGLLGLVDATGLIPDSEDPGTLLQRLRVDVPLVITGIVLLLPYARLRGGPYMATFWGLALLSFLLAGLSAWVVYHAGGWHWLAVPATLLLFGIIAGNCFVLWYWRRHSRTAS